MSRARVPRMRFRDREIFLHAGRSVLERVDARSASPPGTRVHILGSSRHSPSAHAGAPSIVRGHRLRTETLRQAFADAAGAGTGLKIGIPSGDHGCPMSDEFLLLNPGVPAANSTAWRWSRPRLPLALVLLTAAALRHFVVANTDVSWLLTIGEK